MCNCRSSHPGIECNSAGCHCHDNEHSTSSTNPDVYLSISFMKIPRSQALTIMNYIMRNGPADVSFHLDKAIED